MLAAQPGALPDQGLALIRIEDVGEDHDQRPAPLPAAELGERLVVVGLHLTGTEWADRVEEAPHLQPPGSRREGDGDLVGEREEPDPIPGGEGDVDEQQGGVDGVVQLGQGPRPHSHQPAVVEADDDRLGTLGNQLGRHQPPGAGGRLPVDAALGVIRDRLPDPLELGALTRPPLGPHPQLGELATPGQGLVHADGSEVGVDPDRLPLPDRGLAQPEAPGSRTADHGGSEPLLSAPRRGHGVMEGAGQPQAARRPLGREPGWMLVADLGGECPPQAGVHTDVDGHRIRPPDGEDLLVLSGHAEAIPPGSTAPVDEDGEGGDGKDGDAREEQRRVRRRGCQGDQGDEEEHRPPAGHGRRSVPPIPVPAPITGGSARGSPPAPPPPPR